MFLRENSRSEGIFRIVFVHRNHCLHNDRARVSALIDEMHCGSRKFDTIVQGLFLAMGSRKRGEESRVDVHQLSPEMVHKPWGKYAHETGKANQFSFDALDEGNEFFLKCFPGRKLPVIEKNPFDPVIFCTGKAVGFFSITDDEDDLTGDRTILAGVYYGLKIGSAP